MMPPAADEYGYIRVSRKLYTTDPFWLEPRTYSRHEAWEDFIQMAAWKDHRRYIGSTVVELHRGELLASISFLVKRWCWTPKVVRRWLNLVLKMGRVRAERETHFGTVYLLVNYDDYQGTPSEKGTDGDEPGAQLGHSPGTVGAQREVKIKKGKKEKNTYSETFGQAWQEYPSRGGAGNSKADAWASWQARLNEGETEQAMLLGTLRFRDYCHAEKLTGTKWVMQGRRFYGPSRQYSEHWKPTPPEAGKPSPGSEADAIRDELPRSTTPRQGADPLDAHRRQEQEEDERVATWSAENPEQVELIRAEVATAMAAWSGLREETRERIARGEYRKRVLQRLRPAAVA